MAAVHICLNTCKGAAVVTQRRTRVCCHLVNGLRASKASRCHPSACMHRRRHAPAVTQMQAWGHHSSERRTAASVVQQRASSCTHARCVAGGKVVPACHQQPVLAGSRPVCTHTLPTLHAPSQGRHQQHRRTSNIATCASRRKQAVRTSASRPRHRHQARPLQPNAVLLSAWKTGLPQTPSVLSMLRGPRVKTRFLRQTGLQRTAPALLIHS